MAHEAFPDHPIHPLLQQRFSPYGFDSACGVKEADLHALFEAARWAMSSFNAQPWRYIVGVRERSPKIWTQVLDVLIESNQRWARHAPVLALGLAEQRFEHGGEENRTAVHDLGAASAMLTVEATRRGLCVHQMAGIELDRARATFGLAGSLEPVTSLAIGYAGYSGELAEKWRARDRRQRERKPISEILLAGTL